MIGKRLLDIMACPKCGGGVEEKGMFLLCKRCGLAYPVLDGIPDMLVGDAWPLERARREGFRHGLKL